MIAKANAVYTGGNIWLFFGSLTDGNYFLTDDQGWTQILNADPSNLDESTFEDWQLDHLVKELAGDERVEFCYSIIDYLLTHPEDGGGITTAELNSYRSFFADNNF